MDLRETMNVGLGRTSLEKSDVIHAIYERIVIEGPRFVGLRLTPAAYRHGTARALPEGCYGAPDRSQTCACPLGIQADSDRGR